MSEKEELFTPYLSQLCHYEGDLGSQSADRFWQKN